MQIGQIRGIGSSDEPETVYLCGYNGIGAVAPAGLPVFWDSASSDGKTFVKSVEASVRLFAGILGSAVNTADYTAKIVAYGNVNVGTWGIATVLIPGAGLYHTVAKDYLEYGTAAQMGYPLTGIALTALQTNATAALLTTKVFVRAL